MKWHRSLPAGTKDKLFRKANGAYQIEKKVNAIFSQRGYDRIETPIIEFEDVFQNKGKNDEHQFYRFFDTKGRLLVLRPDMTTPIGRVIATTNLQVPLKLAYSGKIFRVNDDMLGEQDELTQAGIELIGYPSIKAELECLLCALELLENLHIENFHFEIGHSAIFRDIVAALHLTESEEYELRAHFNNKSVSGLKRFTKHHPSCLDDFVCAIPFLFGEATKVIFQAKKLLNPESIILSRITELETLVNSMKTYNSEVSLTIDLGLVAFMDYYTGAIFNGYADLAPDIFLRGGRYDRLTEQFDHKAIPAVGFAINLDSIIELQYQTNTLASLKPSKTLVYAPLAKFYQAEELVRTHSDYQLSLFDTLTETIDYGKTWNYKQVIDLTDANEYVIRW